MMEYSLLLCQFNVISDEIKDGGEISFFVGEVDWFFVSCFEEDYVGIGVGLVGVL